MVRQVKFSVERLDAVTSLISSSGDSEQIFFHSLNALQQARELKRLRHESEEHFAVLAGEYLIESVVTRGAG
jgi:hypothetical protein